MGKRLSKKKVSVVSCLLVTLMLSTTLFFGCTPAEKYMASGGILYSTSEAEEYVQKKYNDVEKWEIVSSPILKARNLNEEDLIKEYNATHNKKYRYLTEATAVTMLACNYPSLVGTYVNKKEYLLENGAVSTFEVEAFLNFDWNKQYQTKILSQMLSVGGWRYLLPHKKLLKKCGLKKILWKLRWLQFKSLWYRLGI